VVRMTNQTIPVKTLRQRALDYLAKREYSYQELAQKLTAYAEESDDIPQLLDDFTKRGWLNDARFAEQRVHARKSKFGSARIAQELREKGVDDGLVQQAIVDIKQNEYANAYGVWKKKYKSAPASREDWAKQARFLQSRGFGFDIIKKILNSTLDE
jgi:regulatory protein